MVVLGDSWSVGLYASPLTDGYAYLTAKQLRLTLKLDAVGGTGYLNPGPGTAHGGGTYSQRLGDAAKNASLVIVQGSYNDLKNSATAVKAAEISTLSAVKARYPRAQIVVVGTGDPDIGHEDFAQPGSISLNELDETTRAAAAAVRLNYISPLSEAWFTADRKTELLVTGKTGGPHPSNAGHALFAQRLVADLRKLAS